MLIRLLTLAVVLLALSPRVGAHPLDGEYRIDGEFVSYSHVSFRLQNLKLEALEFGESQSAEDVQTQVIDLGHLALVQFSMGGADGAFQDSILLEQGRGGVRLKSANGHFFDLIEPGDSFIRQVKVTGFQFRRSGSPQ